MKAEEIRQIKRRIIGHVAQELASTTSGDHSKYTKDRTYSMYGKNAFIKGAPKKKK
jgi:hypothetical protein